MTDIKWTPEEDKMREIIEEALSVAGRLADLKNRTQVITVGCRSELLP
jgi:hypothetical protein